MSQTYSQDFYEQQVGRSLESAQVILRLLWQLAEPKSVVDVGCGRGAWLAAADSLGATMLTGLDGSWVKPHDLLSQKIRFIPTDLRREFSLESTYDLCICMEVAEHLPESSARLLVRSLCAASRLVLFSAAVKNQGGCSHVNEQPQSYWVDLFKEAGYDCLDVIRPRIWADTSVDWWYRQNTFLFHHRDSEVASNGIFFPAPPQLANLIHPDHLQVQLTRLQRLHDRPPLRWLIGRVVAYLRQGLTAHAR